MPKKSFQYCHFTRQIALFQKPGGSYFARFLHTQTSEAVFLQNQTSTHIEALKKLNYQNVSFIS